MTNPAKLPAPPAPVAVERSPALLAPRFGMRLAGVLRDLEGQGHTPCIVETMRTDARQAYLYGFGRLYDDGRGIVTHSLDADETWHGFGLAADVVCGIRWWDAPDDFWDALGASARAHGLAWGGDWLRFRDRPHLQFGAPMRRSPSPRAARLRLTGGLPAVWREVGAL